MYYLFLFSGGFLIGLVVAVPIGPVNLICIRRTLSYGALSGFLSGLGGALGDGVFAVGHGVRPDRHLATDRRLFAAACSSWAESCCSDSD